MITLPFAVATSAPDLMFGSAAGLTPYIFAGVSGAAAIACALAALTLRRRLRALRTENVRAVRQATAADLSLERIFFVGPEGGLRPATAATEADAREAASDLKAQGRGSVRLIERMFGREAVRKLAPLLESLAREGRAFELSSKDASGAPTLYIGDIVGGFALLRVWPEAETVNGAPDAVGMAARAATGALAHAPIGVLIFDAEARLTSVNNAARQLLRLRPERLEGAPSLRALIDNLRETGRVPERADFAAWRSSVLANPADALSRSGLWVLGNGDALRVTAEPAAGGGFIMYVLDETGAQGLERRYRIAIDARRATLAAIDEGLAVVGPDGRMQLVNPAFVRMWGVPASLCDERSVGEFSFEDLMRIAAADAEPQTRDIWARVDDALRAQAPRRALTFEADKGDGARLQVLTTPLPDGATLIVIRDVTASHLGAAALRERAASLEASDELKSEFLNNIAYQLRTPLNAALGFTDMLLQDMAGELTDKQREYVSCAHAAADELRELVGDALDLGALAVGSADLAERPLDLGEAANAVATALRMRAKRRGVQFQANIMAAPAPFVGDEPRLRHAVFSVATSLMAAAAGADAVTLRFSVEESGAEQAQAVIEVSLARVRPEEGFEALSEEENVSIRLARRIVEAHGADLSLLANAAGASARFEFPLPTAFTRVDLSSDPERGSARDDAA
ncbi:MAG: PAS-domain containing protein [Neomegalonema sp.]|nr:PAS-domain containing protein [Neomegalonema sp.]